MKKPVHQIYMHCIPEIYKMNYTGSQVLLFQSVMFGVRKCKVHAWECTPIEFICFDGTTTAQAFVPGHLSRQPLGPG